MRIAVDDAMIEIQPGEFASLFGETDPQKNLDLLVDFIFALRKHGPKQEREKPQPQVVQTGRQSRFEELGTVVAGQLDSSLESRIQQLERKLYRDLHQAESRSVEEFARAIQARVIKPMSRVEGSLDEHSQSIQELREKSMKAQRNIEMIFLVVGRVCDRLGIDEVPPFSRPPDPSSSGPRLARARNVMRKFTG